MILWLINNRPSGEVFNGENYQIALGEVFNKSQNLLQQVKNFVNGNGDAASISEYIKNDAEAILRLSELHIIFPEGDPEFQSLMNYIANGPGFDLPFSNGSRLVFGILLIWTFSHRMGFILENFDNDPFSSKLIKSQDGYQQELGF